MFVFYYCLVFASVEQLPSNPYHGERNEGNLCTKVFNKSYIPYTTESREWSVYILRFVFSDKICFPSENSDLLRLIFSELPIEQNHGTWDIMSQVAILERAQLHVKMIYSINHQTQKYTFICGNTVSRLLFAIFISANATDRLEAIFSNMESLSTRFKPSMIILTVPREFLGSSK